MLTQGYDSYLWNPVHRIIRKKISPPLYMISSQLYQKENNIFLNLIITIKLMLGGMDDPFHTGNKQKSSMKLLHR